MLRSLLVILAASSLTTTALAGDVSGRGPNGGRMADVANGHLEFVTAGTEVAVYTFDHDNKPVKAEGATGRVTIQESGKTRTADLKVDGPNRLTATLEAPMATGAKVIVSFTPKGGKPVQARYTAN